MTRQRCRHGFAHGRRCQECAKAQVLADRLTRAIMGRPVALEAALTRARERVRRNLGCALCGQLGHVSKLCPSTAVGRERIARAG